MRRILAVSDRCVDALHALALAASCEGRVTVAVAARRLGVSRSYLAKVMQVLAHRGMLRTTKGAAGGYELSGDPSRLSCLEVVESLEGKLPERRCLFEKPVCAGSGCALGKLCGEVAAMLCARLESTSVAELAAAFKG